MILFVLLIGLIIGSFLNVCIYRIAREESISYPPSHCTRCGYELKWKDLVPVISYLFIKGKCRMCKEKISIRYPIVELVNGIIYCMLFLKFGITIVFIKYCVLASILIVIGMIDYDTKFVYRSTTIFALVTGFVFVIITWVMHKNGVVDSLIGALIGFGIIFLIVILTRGMGEGDIEIATVCGLFLGVKGIGITLFLSVLIGGITGVIILCLKNKTGKSEMAFGPCLAIGSIITMMWGSAIFDIYIKAVF
ncbi:prepilin peptidase [Clostridium gasigenes]|uniref:prepilin peptidase n=1 Tax=Clostridium gasigenes TaxID=94869 RepID=UPI001C0D9176|nr:A24 family peptidase [Clostridium gasigenes]MBU3104716.1 prepilin peptidase [Clostridium gasigenes]